VDTRTAEWIAERSKIKFSSAKNSVFADENEIKIIWAFVRPDVLYPA